MDTDKINVVIIGGGTGCSTLVKGLVKYSDLINISVICGGFDTGGSNKLLIDLGAVPFSDVLVNMLAASSPVEKEDDKFLYYMQKVLSHRFSDNLLEGQRSANLIFAALVEIIQDPKEAIDFISTYMLRSQAKVLPVTYDKADLVAHYQNGRIVVGEHRIDMPEEEFQDLWPITSLELNNPVAANPDAISAILSADIIIYAMGDVFTSLGQNFVVKGIPEAIMESDAISIYIANLMTKVGQTNKYPSIAQHVSILGWEFPKGYDLVDCILVNNTPLNVGDLYKALRIYERSNVHPVFDDADNLNLLVRRVPLVSSQTVQSVKGDKLIRSLIRHDSDLTGRAVIDVILSLLN